MENYRKVTNFAQTLIYVILFAIQPSHFLHDFFHSRSSISSRTPSLDSILSEPNSSMLPNVHYKNRLNVNTSTVFQLQQLPGMNQELAANLIDYRNRKGPFKSLDQLIKVKGISHGRLGAIRSLLCIQEDGKFNADSLICFQHLAEFFHFRINNITRANISGQSSKWIWNIKTSKIHLDAQ